MRLYPKRMTMTFYRKKLNLHNTINVKDVDKSSRVVTVYYAAFDNIDRDGDMIVKGAFAKTIKEQGPEGIGEIWHLIMHDPYQHVARPMELKEDSYGLLSRIKMPDTHRGNDTLNLYLDGHYKHHSIGFNTTRETTKNGYNEIQEVQLFEGSSVLWAANPAAVTVSAKSIFTRDEALEEISKTIKSLRNGTYSDETFSLLEIKLRQLQQHLSDLISSTPAAVKAPEPQKQDYKGLIADIQSISKIFKN